MKKVRFYKDNTEWLSNIIKLQYSKLREKYTDKEISDMLSQPEEKLNVKTNRERGTSERY